MRQGSDILIINQENSPHLDRTIQLIHGLGQKGGSRPQPVDSCRRPFEILEELDLVLVMTVNPGFGGQEFIEYTLRKIRQVRQMLTPGTRNAIWRLTEGSIPRRRPRVVQAGARVLVAGTAVFGHQTGLKAGSGLIGGGRPGVTQRIVNGQFSTFNGQTISQ